MRKLIEMTNECEGRELESESEIRKWRKEEHKLERESDE